MKQRLLNFFALTTLTLAALVYIGVINEFYILALFGIESIATDTASVALVRAVTAFQNKDWFNVGLAIKSLKHTVLHPVLLVYFLRSLLYTAATILTVLWISPYVKKFFVSLRVLEADQLRDFSQLDEEARRSHAVAALRARAARKRVECYSFLAAALVSLVLAIGFITRDHHSEEPGILSSSNASSTLDAMEKPIQVLQDYQFNLMQTESELISMVQSELNYPSQGTANESQAKQAMIAALLARQAGNKSPQAAGATDVARDYLAYGKAQLALIDRQSELAVWQQIIFVVVTKVAAVILILELIRMLVRLYKRGLNLSVHYDGIADSIQMGKLDLAGNLLELRSGLTPIVEPAEDSGEPHSIFDLLRRRFSRGGDESA